MDEIVVHTPNCGSLSLFFSDEKKDDHASLFFCNTVCALVLRISLYFS
ncbi:MULTISPECIES: hypothetical protein [Sulfolobaceae]|nr:MULTISPECIES: hypothetical protein [unclassified Sulfolobus]